MDFCRFMSSCIRIRKRKVFDRFFLDEILFSYEMTDISIRQKEKGKVIKTILQKFANSAKTIEENEMNRNKTNARENSNHFRNNCNTNSKIGDIEMKVKRTGNMDELTIDKPFGNQDKPFIQWYQSLSVEIFRRILTQSMKR